MTNPNTRAWGLDLATIPLICTLELNNLAQLFSPSSRFLLYTPYGIAPKYHAKSYDKKDSGLQDVKRSVEELKQLGARVVGCPKSDRKDWGYLPVQNCAA